MYLTSRYKSSIYFIIAHMKKLLLLVFLSQSLFAQITPYEKSKEQETATYDEIIQFYRELDQKYEQASLIEVGTTDIGKPLHLFVLSANKIFKPQAGKVTLLINNGIHPGEPEGIDASMMWARELLEKKAITSQRSAMYRARLQRGWLPQPGCITHQSEWPQQLWISGQFTQL
jgi:hypothetical protein